MLCCIGHPRKDKGCPMHSSAWGRRGIPVSGPVCERAACCQDQSPSHSAKEHIANEEQIVYIILTRRTFVVGRPNRGHKEWEQWLLLQRYVSSKVRLWISRRPWMPRSPRSSVISARARSCGSARTTGRWIWVRD